MSRTLVRKLLNTNFSKFVFNKKPAMLFKGSPESLMNSLFAYIPDNLKVNLGWDPILDGGNLTFYPLKIVGFKNNPPIGI